MRAGLRYRLSLPLIAAHAAATLANAANSPSFAQEAAPGGAYGGPLLDRSTLTGDWGGTRNDLAARGITVLPSLTGFYQGPTAGNVDHTFDLGGKGDLYLNFDFSKLGLWNGFSAQVHGEYNVGKTPGEIGGTTIPNNTAMTFPSQVSPHFQARPKASEKAAFWRRSSSYRSISGRSLASGMLGMSS